MIGKSLSERYGVRAILPAADAAALVRENLDAQAKYIVEVRASDPNMVACLVLDADDASVRMCRSLGFEMRAGGTGVFGLTGAGAARAFPELPEDARRWLETPCGARETKVAVITRAVGLVSIVTSDGTVTVTGYAPPPN